MTAPNPEHEGYYASEEWQQLRKGSVLEQIARQFTLVGQEFIKLHQHIDELQREIAELRQNRPMPRRRPRKPKVAPVDEQ